MGYWSLLKIFVIYDVNELLCKSIRFKSCDLMEGTDPDNLFECEWNTIKCVKFGGIHFKMEPWMDVFVIVRYLKLCK